MGQHPCLPEVVDAATERRFLLQQTSPLKADIPSGQQKQIASPLCPVPHKLHELFPLLTGAQNHMAGFGHEH
eukprot:7904632-Ditylum_brightwellii.AAC.1